ncbi:MAG TPA: hypothetical protein V6D23_20215, partial [Candidatus Obscuribacterales bacterium]
MRRSRVEESAEGFEVLLYGFQQFGCGPHPSYAISYRVSRDGSFSEISRQLAWADPMLDGLCID